MSTVYEINKGINRSIEFRGLKAQYIVFFIVGIVGLLVLFAMAFLAGVPTLVCIAVTGVLGFVMYSYVYRYSNKYGEHGLMKEAAYRQVPPAIRCRSRIKFFELNEAVKKSENDSRSDNSGSASRGADADTKR
jgi:flagellar biosynthesis component FlhA